MTETATNQPGTNDTDDSDDTEGNRKIRREPAGVEADDTEGNRKIRREPAVVEEDDDTEGNVKRFRR